MKVLVEKSEKKLSEILTEKGINLDLRCGGNGKCGKCKVKLLSGVWEENQQIVTKEALACRTKLLSSHGEIEILEINILTPNGKILQSASFENDNINKDITVIGIDIGTTTIAAQKIENGKVVKHSGTYNLQRQYGDNVLSRISASEKHLNELSHLVKESINILLSELNIDNVSRIGIAGNSVMSCLFHKISPLSIGISPFTLPQKEFLPILYNGIETYTAPLISGYLGGDINVGIAMCNLQEGEMLVDIGTNCEMVYRTKKGYIGTSAAAGPTFEGANLRYGCRAISGAIEKYFGNNNYFTIDDLPPIGICGSALVDILAVERQNNNINSYGKINNKTKQIEISSNININEKEIEQLLIAKGAIYSGIKLLEKTCEYKAKKIYLAGGFADNINIKNAIAIKMLPNRNYEIIGNSSLKGATSLAINPDIIKELNSISSLVSEIPLSSIPNFNEQYIESLLL